ncbi:unnamed protein product [Ectocarpus sp. CCAP 1310/34]|nr:unnamed protein product [Ectocarpus sp. CCAP 1310/34]
MQHHNKDGSITVSTTTTTATTNTRTSTFARPRPSSAAAAAAEAAAVAAAVATAASARAEIPDMKEARPLPQDRRVETGATTGRHAHEQRRAAAASAAGAAAAAAAAAAATVGGRSGGGGAPDVPPYRGPLSAAPLLPPSSSPTGLAAEAGSRGGGRFMPGSAPAPGVATSFGGAKEDTRQRRAKSMSPRQAQERAYLPYDGARPIEIPVGREDEGLLLGGGRVLHKLKEELGGTLEYRRSHGVVCVYGQQGGPRKAAAYVRTALLLRNGRGEPRAEKYDLARLCMDDLLAECIALKGLKQAGTASPGTSSTSSATTRPASYSDGSGSEGSCSPGTDPWSPIQAAAAAATPSVSPSVSSSSSSFAAPDNGRVAAAIAAAAAVTVASNLPDGEYPPETSSLRIIGEKFGCVIDVVGEAAAAAAAAAVNASAAACEGSQGGAGADAISPLQAVGSATPVGHQDILIWGPAGVVGEAKDAVCSLVSGSASAEVVVGVGRIGRRDRGFWVNCETMPGGGGASLEVDHKRGVVVVRGLPEEVEEGRKEFQDKLASLFPGEFLAVPMPRAALKDLADAQGLARAAEQAGVVGGRDERPDGCDEAGGVELWADWPFSCVRLRGEPATVRRAAKALYAALALWNTLEVSVTVDRAIVTRLLSRSGRILAGISSNMGITLLVEREKGVLRGRARTEDEAKEANRVLKLKVAALAQRRSEQMNAANSAAAAPKAPVLSPGLSSTHSERSCVSVEDGPRLELTDAFEELQAFFGGGPPDGGVPSAPTKEHKILPTTLVTLTQNMGGGEEPGLSPPGGLVVCSTQESRKLESIIRDTFVWFPSTSLGPSGWQRSCVFDGVEDVPSSTGFPPGSLAKGLGTRRKAGPSRPVAAEAVASGRGRGCGGGGGGVGSARAVASGLTAARPHVVDVNRRSVMIHHPVLSPSSSVGSPPFSPPPAGAVPDAGGYHHRAGVRDMHRHKQHAFHAGAIAVSPSPSPSPTRLMNLTAHHYYAQEAQYHHGSPEGWPVPREEQLQQHHLRCHQQHVASHGHHQQQQQQQRQLLSMDHRGGGICQATREAVAWVDCAEEFGTACSEYGQRSRQQQYLATEDDYLYHRSGEGFRVGSVPPGYCSTTTPSSSNAVGNELRGEFLSQGFTAAQGGIGNEANYYDGDAPPPARQQQQLGRWKSDDPGCYRSTVASSYPASAAATSAAFGRGGSNVRGW